MLNKVSAMDIISSEELYSFVQDLLDKHGETPEQLMILLVKLTTAKAIIEDALGLDEPMVATVEHDDDQDSDN